MHLCVCVVLGCKTCISLQVHLEGAGTCQVFQFPSCLQPCPLQAVGVLQLLEARTPTPILPAGGFLVSGTSIVWTLRPWTLETQPFGSPRGWSRAWLLPSPLQPSCRTNIPSLTVCCWHRHSGWDDRPEKAPLGVTADAPESYMDDGGRHLPEPVSHFTLNCLTPTACWDQELNQGFWRLPEGG